MRDYDPTFARYLSVDPLGTGGGRNRFTYAGANPQNLVDPEGLEALVLGDPVDGLPSPATPGELAFATGMTVAPAMLFAAPAAGAALCKNLLPNAAKKGRDFLRNFFQDPIDPNRLNHIFGQARHNLGPLVQRFGSQEATFKAVESATRTAVKSQGLTGVFETTVRLAGQNVVVRGRVVDGIARIGTFFIP